MGSELLPMGRLVLSGRNWEVEKVGVRGVVYGLRLVDEFEYRYIGVTTNLLRSAINTLKRASEKEPRLRSDFQSWFSANKSDVVVDVLFHGGGGMSFSELRGYGQICMELYSGQGHKLLNKDVRGREWGSK